jgi:WS/DGAT/MGAT family acyltransferase
MKQLNIQDAGFIIQETDKTPMHICGVSIYNQPPLKGKQRASYDEIIDYIQARIHVAPIMQQKLKRVPGDWDRPYWIKDSDFSLRQHINHIALPAPGDRKQFYKLCSDIMSRPLNLKKPLWEIWIVEGLNDIEDLNQSSFALITKIHHACVDGSSGGQLVQMVNDMQPDGEPWPADPIADELEERIPGQFEMRANAFANNMISAFGQTASIAKRLPQLTKIATDLAKGERKTGAVLSVPTTRFNRTPSENRIFYATTFELTWLKAIRKNLVEGATINDVMVTIVAGGLRRYLAAKNELPELPMAAMLPKSLRAEGDTSKAGNAVGGLLVNIQTDIEDDVARLAAVHDRTTEAKEFSEHADTDSIFPNLMGGFLYPRNGKRLVRAQQRLKLMNRIGAVGLNTIITNVPGPNFSLYHMGARMVSFAGVPPLIDGVGIAHAIYSYCGNVQLSVMSCDDMMPDPEFYEQCLLDAYGSLIEALPKAVVKTTQAELINNSK